MSEVLADDRASAKTPPSQATVGVLSFHNSKETKAILNAIRSLGHEPVWLREENTRSWMANGTLQFKPDVDIVVNRLLATKSKRPLEDLGVVASYAAARPVLNPPENVMQAMHKYGAAATLASAGLPVPDAYMAFTYEAAHSTAQPLDGHAVRKPMVGTNGEGISLVKTTDELPPQIARRRAFLQQYLDAESERPFDIRVYVVGGRIIGAMKRYAPPNEWRTNVALGGAVEDVTDDISPGALTLARTATDILNLDYAGVDLIEHRGNWTILEVNATAGFKGLFDATGKSPAPYIAQLALERLDMPVDTNVVADMANELDDSVPGCTPRLATTNDRKAVIGYTERIAIGGDREVHHAIAKADTGAKRTSVDLDIAAAIGAGPIIDTTIVRSGVQGSNRKRPLVELEVKLGDHWQTTMASIEDRGHMNYPVLLGRDLLRGYRIDINRRVAEE